VTGVLNAGLQVGVSEAAQARAAAASVLVGIYTAKVGWKICEGK
jgi:hypothetical protein